MNGRYFDEDKVTFYTADVSGRAGTGLWGPTPEEAEYAAFQEALQKMFVTVTMWATEDRCKMDESFWYVYPGPSGRIWYGNRYGYYCLRTLLAL